jgi:DNA primase
MAGRIPQSFIDDLLARVDIVDVVDSRVPLKKQGSNWSARCPFHDEKTPSFTVTQTKQLYYCFGCGAGGSALGFVMAYEQLDFVEAIERLAGELGLEVPRTGTTARDEDVERLHGALARADAFYQRRLRHAPEAIDYLRQRGITGGTAKRFGLGYAPAAWRELLDESGAGASEDLLRAGLVNRSESGRVYDRFRGRVLFPIRDRRGRTIAFGGRVLDDSTPKYLNSPETAVFHKGRELYGLYEARRARREPPRLLVVEGYMDVLMLAEHGIDYAVATLGTALGETHVTRLFGVASEVVFCFDGDEAGRQAAWRALATTLPALTDGREARFLFLPEGADPDSAVRAEGRSAFEARLAGARPLADFLIDRLTEGVDTTSVGGRAQLAAEARPLLATMPAGVYHDLLIERLATAVGLAPERLRADLAAEAPTRATARPAPRPPQAGSLRMNPMRAAIGLLLQYPTLIERLPADHPALAHEQPGKALLADLRAQIAAAPDTHTGRLLEAYRDTAEHRHLQWLAAYTFATDAESDRAEALAQEFDDALMRLEKQGKHARREALVAAARERALSAAEKTELQTLLRPG